MFTLIIEDQEGNIADEYSFEDGEFVVGRSHSSDIILPSDNVSRRHARLFTRDGRCFVEDLASSNGVFVDGERIHRTTEVPHSGQIKVGDYYLHVEGARVKSQPEPEPVQGAVDFGQAQSERAGPAIFARLVGSSPDVRGQVFDINRSVSLLGRGKDCAVTVVDASISRVHAKLLRNQDGSMTVEDLRSANGTYVNDQRVEQAIFRHGDRLRFGNIEFVVELPGFGEPEEVETSSAGKWLLVAAIAVLALGLGVGAVLFFQGDDEKPAVAKGEAADDDSAGTDDANAEEERQVQYERAEERLDGILKRATRLATTDKWSQAEALLLEGKKLLDSVASVDTQGALTARFESTETELRTARVEYKRLLSALAERDYKTAGSRYQAIVKRKGPFVAAAERAVEPEKTKLVSSGQALCSEKVYGKCLDYYQKAKALDPMDKGLQKKVAELRLKIATGGE